MASVLAFISVVLIVAAASKINQTYDEPFHVARGLQWYQTDKYDYIHHPPLAPVCFATPLQVMGAEYEEHGHKLSDGNQILYSGDYAWNLAAARSGNLLFYLLMIVACWFWARLLATPPLLVVGCVSLFPPVLAHAGLATSDLAITCGILWYAYFGRCFLAAPCARSGASFGVSIAACLLAKFSAVVFLPLVAVSLAIVDMHLVRKALNARRIELASGAVLAVAVAALCVWGGYRFSFGTVEEVRWHSSNPLRFPFVSDNTNRRLLALTVPAPEFVGGILSVLHQNREGHYSYFLGESVSRSSVLYFPVLLLTKSPIPLLLLSIVGFASKRPHAWVPAFVIMAILAPACLSNINIGVRHILPVYPWLGILAAMGFTGLRGQALAPIRSFSVILLAWAGFGVVVSMPDLLPYFNEFAFGRPERITVDSDLDWGQDLQRLGDEIRERQIAHIHIAYFGTAVVEKHIPTGVRVHHLKPHTRVSGWVAVSAFNRFATKGYEWLDNYEKACVVGASIYLYHIPRGRNAGHPAPPQRTLRAELPEKAPTSDN